MSAIKDYVDSYLNNTEAMIARVFKSGPGFPVAVNLDPDADLNPPLHPIYDQFPKVQWQGVDRPADIDLFGAGATRAVVEADIAQLATQLPARQQEHDEKAGLLKTLSGLINFSADRAPCLSASHHGPAVRFA